MRLTKVLCAQHLGWSFKQQWKRLGNRSIKETIAVNELQNLGISAKDPAEVLKSLKENRNRNNDFISTVTDEGQNCLFFGSGNVLLDGLQQAQVLTNTVTVTGFPKNVEELLENTVIPNSVDRSIQRAILFSNVFDAEQVKTISVENQSNPNPMYKFPRHFGISPNRRNRLLINNLLMECEKSASQAVTSSRRLLDNANFAVTMPKEEDLLHLNLKVDKIVTSTKAIEPIKGKFDSNIPDLYPIKSTISLNKQNVSNTETQFPLSRQIKCSHPHTVITFFNKESVKNLHGNEVTSSQLESRTMLNAFGVAAARAKQLYGEECLRNIPKPIVVQSIQTDGRSFHFGVFQLNTLDLTQMGDKKNLWFNKEIMYLYTQCGSEHGRPFLEGYNNNVFRCLSVLYNNM